MSLDQDDLRKIAFLARIKIEDAELEPLADELNSIIGWVEQLGEVDTDGVQPMTSVAEMLAPQRPGHLRRCRRPRSGRAKLVRVRARRPQRQRGAGNGAWPWCRTAASLHRDAGLPCTVHVKGHFMIFWQPG